MAKKERVVLTTPIFRVGFPNLFEPTAFKNKDGTEGKKKYNVVAIFTPGEYKGKEKERWDALVKALDDATREKFGMSWKEAKKHVVDGEIVEGVPNFKEGLYNGKKKTQDGFGEGTYYATLSTEYPPGVVQYNGVGKKSTTISEEEGNTNLIYPGCYARATVGPYAYDSVSKGAAIGLNNFQKVKDGERLDGRGDAADDFEDDIDSSFLDQDEPPVEDDFL